MERYPDISNHGIIGDLQTTAPGCAPPSRCAGESGAGVIFESMGGEPQALPAQELDRTQEQAGDASGPLKIMYRVDVAAV